MFPGYDDKQQTCPWVILNSSLQMFSGQEGLLNISVYKYSQTVPLMFFFIETNSLTVIITANSGITDFPEFTKVAMVNGVQVNYHDSHIQRSVPRQQFMADSFGVEFWEYLTDLVKSFSDGAMENLNTILKSTNQTSVQPEVFISRSGPNSQYKPLTLSCLVTGFYPVDIEVSWLRNGEVMSETLSSGVRPNHDGTHQIQKEIEINAGDEDQYSCQIEHSSQAETQLSQWDIPGNSAGCSHLGMIFGLVAALAALLLIIGIIIWKSKQRDSPNVTYTTAQNPLIPSVLQN
ncbi:HLA class II histocompatibility antigen, DR beta 4 chain-like isoform X5 [Carcharodon carcharias]|uniref:HLA class II histocompatibility antigen, DR beta 4 chain-like isoform X5 n=1 Tax=Carcharodon carcharias TaxID=13397 RepID=UPI001B7DF80F|nr:HLA class II histocompatibility antigen, DR beta 4 chain-like isoform X5 [Carcharodon carcharias]